MATLDIFGDDAFSVASMTASINSVPYKPMRIGQLGLFEESGISTTTAMIERQGQTLALIPTTPRGGAGIKNVSGARDLVAVKSVRILIEDDIQADEVQNVRAFGSETEVETVQGRVNQKLAEMAGKIDVTLEWQRIGAIKGQVLDADGSTVLWNMFTTFDVTAQSEIDFDLDNASPGTRALWKKCQQVIGLIEDELGGLTYQRVHAFVSQEFWDALMSHKEILDTYQANNAAQLRDLAVGVNTYTYGGITFERYRGGVGSTRFVATNKAHFFPVGVPGLFRTVYVPADYMETVNTVGLPRYARQDLKDKNRGVEVEAQSNPIHLVTRPRVLVPGRMT